MADTYGKCLANVNSFVTQYKQNAQTLATMLGNDVTVAEVLAVAGNESTYGTSDFADFGNFFGLHGKGPAGTYYTKKNHTPVMKFAVQNGLMISGQVFVTTVKPFLKVGMGDDPLAFFTILNNHGYATGNSGYPAMMINADPNNRGPYILVKACLAGSK